MGRPVVVTGIGLVSCLGEGIEAHLAAFAAGGLPPVDADRFAPYPVHPTFALEWDRQIPKKSDQRQMEPWQRLGVYAAGLALDSAGAKEDADLHTVIPPRCVIPQLKPEFFRSPFFRRFHIQSA